MYDFNFDNSKKTEKTSRFQKLTKNQKIAFCCGAVAVVLVLVLLFAKGCSGSGGNGSRKNTVSLVKMYMERGEYDRALDKLDDLLIQNANDKEAKELLNKILALRNAQGSDSTSVNPNVNVTVDTEGITAAMQSSIDSMRSEFEKTNAENERSRKEMAELLKQQQEAASLEKERQEELKQQQKAAEEQRKKEEAARLAKEAELAKKNAKLKQEIASVNDEIQQGKTALNSGNIDNAIKHFATAQGLLPVSEGEPEFSVSKNSEMAGALYDASLTASNSTDKEKLLLASVEYAARAISQDPKDAASQYILGMEALEKKNYQKALDHLTKAAANDTTKNYLYYYNLGRVQYMMKKFTEAKYSFTTSCQLNGNFAPARYNLGLTENRLNDSKSALQDFRRAHDIDPRHEKAYLEEARVLANVQKDYPGAINAYQNVLKINSTNRNALNELGYVYFQAKKYSEAEETFRKSLALLPAGTSDPMTYFNLSSVLFEEKKLAEALNAAKKAYESNGQIADKKSRANIIYNYALLLEKTGNADSAIAVYAEALQNNPEHLKSQINLGVMYMNSNPPDIDTALSLFLKAYATDSKNFEVNNNLGSAYLEKKDYENAIKYFQTALTLDTRNNDVRFNLAQAFASNKQYDNAKTTYIQVLQQNDSYLDAYVELAKVYMALGDNSSAEKYLVAVQSKNSSFRKTEVDSLLSSIARTARSSTADAK